MSACVGVCPRDLMSCHSLFLQIRVRRSDSSGGASPGELMAAARDEAGETGGHPVGSPRRTVLMPAAGQAGVFGDPGSAIQTAPEVSSPPPPHARGARLFYMRCFSYASFWRTLVCGSERL